MNRSVSKFSDAEKPNEEDVSKDVSMNYTKLLRRFWFL